MVNIGNSRSSRGIERRADGCNYPRCHADPAPGSYFCVEHQLRRRRKFRRATAAQPTTPHASVFVVQGDRGFKFGCAWDIPGRVIAIEQRVGEGPIELLGTVAGDRRLVEAIHRVLREHRQSGEWYPQWVAQVERIAHQIRDGHYPALVQLIDS